jgi:general stress protein 26
MELQQKIFQALSDSRTGSFATVTPEGKPWVRYVMLTSQEDLTLSFATGLNSRKVQHIKNNPEVHILCGIDANHPNGDCVQIQGVAEISVDEKQKHAFWNKNFEMYFSGPDDPNYAVVIIKPYRIEYIDALTWKIDVWKG